MIFDILFLTVLISGLIIGYKYIKLKGDYRQNTVELTRSREKYSDLRDFLSAFSTSIREGGGLDGGLRNVAKYIAGQLHADAVGFYEYAEGELRGSGVYGFFPLVHSDDPALFADSERLLAAFKLERYELGEGLIGMAAREMQPMYINDCSTNASLAEFPLCDQIGGLLFYPIRKGDDSLLGLICAVKAKKHNEFSGREVEILEQLFPHLSFTDDLLHSYKELSVKERLDQELSFVRQLQFSMLPKEFPAWEQFSVTAFSRPAKEVNGDFYDFVEIDENRLLIVLGDATGKGLPACMLTAMTRSIIRAMVENFTNLSDFLFSINRKLYRNTEDERFVTLGCCLLDRRNSLMEFGRAGHTELLTFVHNHIRAIAPDGTALGIVPEEFAEFDTFCLALEPGMSLLMYSDGITEAIDANEEEFGVERLQSSFERGCREELEPEEIIGGILSDVEHFSVEQGDDQTLIIIRHLG